MIAAECAPYVAPSTLAAVIRVESDGNALALYVNGLEHQPMPPRSRYEAVETAQRFMRSGYSVDLGLMQVNSRHLAAFGVTVEQMLEPYSCANIRVGAAILSADYIRATILYGSGQRALRAALSAYNTGSFYSGSRYIARYVGSISKTAPHQPVADTAPLRAAQSRPSTKPYEVDTEQAAAEWGVASE